jgi:hypothetical protein
MDKELVFTYGQAENGVALMGDLVASEGWAVLRERWQGVLQGMPGFYQLCLDLGVALDQTLDELDGAWGESHDWYFALDALVDAMLAAAANGDEPPVTAAARGVACVAALAKAVIPPAQYVDPVA